MGWGLGFRDSLNVMQKYYSYSPRNYMLSIFMIDESSQEI